MHVARITYFGICVALITACDKPAGSKDLIGRWHIDVPAVHSHIEYTFYEDHTYTLKGEGPPMYGTNVVLGTWSISQSELTTTASALSNTVTHGSEPFSSTDKSRVTLTGSQMVWHYGPQQMILQRTSEK